MNTGKRRPTVKAVMKDCLLFIKPIFYVIIICNFAVNKGSHDSDPAPFAAAEAGVAGPSRLSTHIKMNWMT